MITEVSQKTDILKLRPVSRQEKEKGDIFV